MNGDDEPEQVVVDKDATPEVPPFLGFSPPLARRLRSTKKPKRTRSNSKDRTHTSQKRVKLDDGNKDSTEEPDVMERDDGDETDDEESEQDDEQMTVEEDTPMEPSPTTEQQPSEQQPQLVLPQTAVITQFESIVTATSNGTTIKQLDRIETLKMPSQQTPVKILDTNHDIIMEQPIRGNADSLNLNHRSASPVEPPSATRVTTERPQQQLQADLHDIMALPEPSTANGWIERSSITIETTIANLQDVVGTMIVPRALDGQNNGDGVEMEQASSPRLFKSSIMWFMFGLVLQLIACYHLGLNTVVEGVHVSTVLKVKHWIGVRLDDVAIPEYIQLPDQIITKARPLEIDPNLHLGQLRDLETLASRLRTFDGSLADLANTRVEVESELGTLRSIINEKRDFFRKWETALEQSESEVQEMMARSDDSLSIPLSVQRVRAALSRMGEYSILTPCITATNAALWNVASSLPACVMVEPTLPDDALLTHEQLLRAKEKLYNMGRTALDRMKQNDQVYATTARTLIRRAIGDIATNHTLVGRDDSTMEKEIISKGLSKREVLEIISNQLEREWADKTGETDFASLHSGSSVIRHGPRATSPSLIDTLPLFNMLLMNTKLRFYGYGPEAALTPTKPSNALGQCWSFSDASRSKKRQIKNAHRIDNTNGKYATLSVKLAKPISIRAVILEHPSFTTGQPQSAVHQFRVFGYIDGLAAERPVALGEFTFENANSMQIFPISEKPNMKFQSVTLAIDSNYGYDYTCLYRFRVQGRLEE